jgi:crotonobetainyl-CoA:carnitine CoA-transferase CaiB-like acyl-CoA transferase
VENGIPSLDAGSMPLAGMRVLDLMTGALGSVSRTYAELGADVIRLEPPGGSADRREGRLLDGTSLDFVAANLGKRSAGLDQLGRLAKDADLLVAPLGAVDVDVLRAENPALVVLSISDFGETGRFTSWAGSEAVHYALSGQLSRSGLPDREPLLPPDDLGLACAASQAACLGLVAYWHRLGCGVGDHLDFSVLDGVAQVLDPAFGIGGSAALGVPVSQLPRGRPDARLRYPILRSRDGFVRLCVLAPRQWQGLFEWMGRPDEFADPAFNNLQTRYESPTLLPAIQRFLAEKSSSEIEEQSVRFGVPVSTVLSVAQALETEQLQARRAFAAIEVAPGVSAPFPNGVLEVYGVRMGVAGPAPATPSGEIHWLARSEPDGAGAASVPPGALALEGIRVLDFGVLVVGAESGRLLGDMGADVIKIESSAFPDGARMSVVPQAMSVGFASGSRNKRSLGLNLREAKGMELLLQLARDTDVVLVNFKGGTLESLGLDYASLKAVNPRIIVCDSSAYGSSGPFFRRMGYGPLVRAGSGLTMEWRYPGDPEGFADAITIYPDHVGGRVGMIGVMALLIRRRRTGLGGQVGISQAELMLGQMGAHIAADALTRAGKHVDDLRAKSFVHPCAGDDEWCVVTIRGEQDERALAQVTCGAALTDWLAARAPRDAMEALQAAGIPAAAMLRVPELPEFGYFVERGAYREVRHPLIAEPFLVDDRIAGSEHLPPAPQKPAPLPGEHTQEIAKERLGLDEQEIDALIAAGALEQYGRKA